MPQPPNRWTELVGEGHGHRYDQRFSDLAASGVDVHGEARFCAARLRPGARILDAGCGTGRVAVWLAEQGFDCVGVDVDASMLDQARARAPQLPWVHRDLAELDSVDLGADFDAVIAAGNVIPLLAGGTEARAVGRLAERLRPDGLLIAGFGLDAAHLPLSEAPVQLADYDSWCRVAGLELRERYATWDGDPYTEGGYAVSVHTRPR
ncbi:class I SAM-dependent methyltransferase [Lipingzhangella sp. LS1_29]|uniref:Class I SAM-dependent methyltransferase n=1 Tax=Lipingzhangella rawalii TaxID=2055835 RepID=A0ABU2H164_9ACTN|nr:class I SAM-dependent methyltransferase [Lipingzhangella rawalii]MDS1269041.1 class I SAM-dependent methyltransferase [Lipingzhangella rawalii]